ncbi:MULTISPECIES: conjugal transfer protein TrbH [unclassified Bradyrhizobium]|uniref:conjugal transfer protein TrbH n=1 Tax=unclassified Bradyrhizobium TaxID=2631580 RepID=UPI00102A8497|nr:MULTISPECIES: conjugal transfer protein TrbH [unclassified Bradyrhizobium]RZN13867.1 conjugal transfer protein TrbH [Bradyrhizobium sp. Leo121]TAI60749.1 conjugal transfer protein TrbH [Bradyrhizobium sp. Leo170]
MRQLSSMPRLVLLSVLSLPLAGCATFGGGGALVASSAPSDLSSPAASAIAGDMVTKFAEQVGPGDRTIILKPDGTPFGQALETSLKSWGYAVATDQKTKGEKTIPLAYVIESYNGQVLARLSTGSVELGRAYSATAAGASPASPLSVMQRG